MRVQLLGSKALNHSAFASSATYHKQERVLYLILLLIRE